MDGRPLDALSLGLSTTALVEASAGTGKTFTIATLYVRLVLDGFEVPRILVVTYTKAATAELRDRIRRRLRQALQVLDGVPAEDETLAAIVASRRARDDLPRDRLRLLHALRSFDEAAIFTIHAFCQRTLHDHAFESGVAFDAELVAEQDLLRDEVVRDFWARRIAPLPRWLFEGLLNEDLSFLRLSQLAARTASRPDVPVLPSEPPAADLEGALTEWRTAWERAASLWRSDRERILALLEQPKVLNKKPFDQIRVRFGIPLDDELSAPRPWVRERFERLRFLTPDELSKKTLSKQQPPQHPFFEAVVALIAAEEALAASVRSERVRLELELVVYARSEIARRQEAANVQSFDDLLRRLARALEREPSLAGKIRGAFPTALVDEFQDTDDVQYAIFRAVYLSAPAVRDGAALFLIGDPKQAIYSFRGADVFTYMRCRADVGREGYSLVTNRRSDPRLVEAVNALFGSAPRPFVLEDIGFSPARARPEARDLLAGSLADSPPFEILLAPVDGLAKLEAEDRITRWIAAEISRLLQSGARLGADAIAPGDVTVLCRTNRQAARTLEALRRLGVPAVLYGDSSVLDADDAVEVERVLRAMAEPGDAAAIRAALVTSIVGLGADELERLRDDEDAWDREVARFGELSEIWRARGFVAAFWRMMDLYDVSTRLLARIDGERRLTNVLHLGELLQNAAATGHRGPLALVEWLRRMCSDRAVRGELAADAAQIRLESDAARVKLTTVHQAKGLEYPIVYCPFLWTPMHPTPAEGFAFHDTDADGQRRFDIGSPHRDEHARLQQREELAESLRLLYVALTRARHRCTVVWGRFEDGGSSALGYLLHRPADLPTDLAVEWLVPAIQKRIDSGSAFEEDLRELEAAAPRAIGVRTLSVDPDVPFPPFVEVERIVPARKAKRVLDATWRTSSFTRLAAGGAPISASAEEGIDHDEAAEAEGAEPQPETARLLPLHDFPKGARSGELLHEILENVDFRASRDELAKAVRSALAGHGFEVDRFAVPVTEAIAGVLATPLSGPAAGLELRALSRERRISEMEFLFPVAEAGTRRPLDGRALAAAFRRHLPSSLAGYPQRVERLRFAALHGFLRGFVDLVFEHEGRWYVVDWKSNVLGPSAAAYAPGRLVAAMESHHYVLQYHLYAVALHRHLRARLPDYTPARHFGGVYYLFLRGMSVHHPTGTGIFHDRPTDAFLEDLSDLLHDASTTGRGRRP